MEVKVQRDTKVMIALNEREASVLSRVLFQAVAWNRSEIGQLAESISLALEKQEIYEATDVTFFYDEKDGMFVQEAPCA